MVLADPHTLTTLGSRELSEGWAEAIKHGFIMDADLVSVFENHASELMGLEPELSTEVIRRSIAIKAGVVSEDERETLGKRGAAELRTYHSATPLRLPPDTASGCTARVCQWG